MKKLTLVLTFFVLILSCQKDDKVCNCKDPLTDLPWLLEVKASMTDCACETSIIEATFKKQTVFYTAMTDALCDGYYSYVIYDCSGNVLKGYQPNDQSFSTEVTDRKVLYRCKTNK